MQLTVKIYAVAGSSRESATKLFTCKQYNKYELLDLRWLRYVKAFSIIIVPTKTHPLRLSEARTKNFRPMCFYNVFTKLRRWNTTNDQGVVCMFKPSMIRQSDVGLCVVNQVPALLSRCKKRWVIYRRVKVAEYLREWDSVKFKLAFAAAFGGALPERPAWLESMQVVRLQW